MKRQKILCIDFDGTAVGFNYPNIGKEIGATPYLKKLTNGGVKLILFTMRSHKPQDNFLGDFKSEFKDCLQEAIDWFKYESISK